MVQIINRHFERATIGLWHIGNRTHWTQSIDDYEWIHSFVVNEKQIKRIVLIQRYHVLECQKSNLLNGPMLTCDHWNKLGDYNVELYAIKLELEQ